MMTIPIYQVDAFADGPFTGYPAAVCVLTNPVTEETMQNIASESDILSIKPDFRKLATADGRGMIVTAPGSDVDFFSRFFAPQAGIDEDPVTGSAHTTLTPFWSDRLGKKILTARQLSARGGLLGCTNNGDRTMIAGRAILYLKGEIYV